MDGLQTDYGLPLDYFRIAARERRLRAKGRCSKRMSRQIALYHNTTYRYERAIHVGPQVVRLRPAAHCRTPIRSYSLRITPGEHFLNWQQDVSGNFLARIVFPEPTDTFSVEVDLVAEMVTINPFDFFVESGFEHAPIDYPEHLNAELAPYMAVPEEKESIYRAWLSEARKLMREAADAPIVQFLSQLNRRVNERIRYLIRMEPGVQEPGETLMKAGGSCRDSAWLLALTLRELGFASRFVSGYLIQLAADQKAVDGPSGPETDFTDLHAWCETYIPGAGWIGLDATSGLFAGEGHIPLACSPDPVNAAPITGTHEPAEARFSYDMNVTRLRETPRASLPYTEETFAGMDRLGLRVDADLAAENIQLTMGGEPTFVHAREPDALEWNTHAMGGRKRELGARLLYGLRESLAPGGVPFHGQGKWYPGEELPRWALGNYFRVDGKSVWRRQELLAREAGPDGPPRYEFGTDHARGLMEAIAERLRLRKDYVKAARDPMAAESSAARGDAAVGEGTPPTRGFVLPLRRWEERDCWASAPWSGLGDPIILTPGDSPMGYRLPLSHLPAESPFGYSFSSRHIPFDSPPDLPAPHHRDHVFTGEDFDKLLARDGIAAESLSLHTALCVEEREGALYVFLPPQNRIETWLELIAVVESAAAYNETPIFLEGYPPPADPRVRSILVTPDPGVLEVNIPPMESWRELRELTEKLFETARGEMLVAEKFELDGRPSGSGGGNHITLGGPVPAQSVFLNRPGLLRSLITYFQHHPALSYLFSGLFVGPTSQAPRVDEGRHESLYEMEIAFEKLPEMGDMPWLCDRLLRHHLTDLTGNTHRAEICIDKLYSPDRPEGRLGIVELRAFEMLPHPRMNLAVYLLVRAIIARLARSPYHERFTRWGTALQDRFLLPHYLEGDLDEIRSDLSSMGYEFRAEYFAPILEFRFPVLGTAEIEEVVLEIRAALEPWHVLGEENIRGATARMVDSSADRIQLTARNLDPSRHAVLCNGFLLPLRPAGRPGDFTAGVRFKAWHLTHSLHPNLKVHAPLTFDLVDIRYGRSLGGCVYHVSHPGGRNYDTRPVNSNEAEARRLARFSPGGHTPGPVEIPPLLIDPDFPHTLDLRRLDP